MAITYKDAGVDIDAGDDLVERIKPLARRVRIPEVLDDVGGFAGLCRVPAGLTDPVLVSGADGVGTKLEVAFATGVHDTVGIDLVAMCVNDVVTTGARPLFFLDYFASSKLDVNVAEAVIRGIAEGCRQSGCALLGGETAELPGMYRAGVYELAGFAVGVVERARILNGSGAKAGDAVVAIGSSGLHSNGYSLARKVAGVGTGGDLDKKLPGTELTIGQALLTPTKIYARQVAELLQRLPPGSVRALSHITGGGLEGNLPRVLPDGLGARLDLKSFERPAVFRWLQQTGPVEEAELRKTFNVGVGMCVVVDAMQADEAIRVLQAAGERAWRFGELESVPVDTPFERRVRFD